VLGTLLLSGPATAREAFTKGTLALGAERLSGAFHADTNERNTSVDTFAVLGAGGDPGTAASVFQFPRFTFDGFVADGVSIGSSMIAFSRRQKQRDTYDRSTETAVIVGPRVGFASMLSRHVGIWLRIGVSYSYFEASPVDYRSHCISMNVEAPILILPVEQVAITVGPMFDAGRVHQSGENLFLPDVSLMQLGLAAGITVLF
jgi:hypothetical protein